MRSRHGDQTRMRAGGWTVVVHSLTLTSCDVPVSLCRALRHYGDQKDTGLSLGEKNLNNKYEKGTGSVSGQLTMNCPGNSSRDSPAVCRHRRDQGDDPSKRHPLVPLRLVRGEEEPLSGWGAPPGGVVRTLQIPEGTFSCRTLG